MLLKDQVSLITGSAQGIGKEIALLFAKEGSHVALVDLNEQNLAKTRSEIESLGVKCLEIQANVTQSAQVDETVKKCVDTMGRIDILVNNAGITRDNLLVRMSEEDWDLVLSINLKGTFLFTKAVAKIMMKQRSGRIINIASIIGLMGNAGQANYGASKAGVIGLTKSTAKELCKRGINVNAIAPGFIKTAMTDKLSEDIRNLMLAQIPLERLGNPEDVAHVALFLASKYSSYITGQVIQVDGGMLM
ncbi:MAG: 3-oxoacyl-[acyl-carrier-protein] reductase [Candidatus Omnitrophica bacterium]|nr:3-oxoacyl-[acyl-carrier-protein] reductase [Candidatus Omnitrophota bacterium]